MWLKDFLPKDVPFARIMTFGYDSVIAFSSSVARVDDKALELLNQLSIQRRSSKARPIVFVCHSYGGIIVKKALILAHEQSNIREFRDILESTKGIAFLGVPHRGSDSAWWATFAARALKTATGGTATNTLLVSKVRKGSTTLMDISIQFLARTKGLQIYTSFETRKLDGSLVGSATHNYGKVISAYSQTGRGQRISDAWSL